MIKKEVHNVESNKLRCIKTVYVKNDFVKICGRFSSKIAIVKSNGICYKLNLCKECFEEFKKEELKEQERKEKNWEKTKFKCPECGSIVYKHYHIKSGLYPEYHWFWCSNFCDLGCHNCKYGTDTHGDVCGAFFCLNYSGWEPIEKT